MAEALLVVDVQRGFLHPQLPARNNDGAEEKMQKIMEDFRCSGREIIHIQHRGTDSSSFFYDEENIRFQSGFEPRVGEKVFTKNVNSAFIGTNLLAYLRERGIDRLTVMGCTLPHCVSTTVRMAANYGFQVTLVEDACVTFALSLSQRLSHACLSTHGRYSETANGSLNQLWFLWSLAPLLLG